MFPAILKSDANYQFLPPLLFFHFANKKAFKVSLNNLLYNNISITRKIIIPQPIKKKQIKSFAIKKKSFFFVMVAEMLVFCPNTSEACGVRKKVELS